MSFTMQTIESQDLALFELFNDFYIVPDYQREYVWETMNVEQILEDIYNEFTGNPGSNSSEYFIGSIVVLAGQDQTYEIIDGQQRMTTLFLTLCAIRDYLRDLGLQPPQVLSNQIAAPSINRQGEGIYRYRVTLQYEDSKGILETIGAENGTLLQIEANTRSVSNILNAYHVVREFLQHQFGKNDEEVRKFYAFLTFNVKLIRVKTTSMTHALKVFETINDRGVGLDSMDLLKNLLFMHASPTEFEKLKITWKKLVNTLYQAKEKPLRFLRYYIFASYDVDRLREEEIYRWFMDNKGQVKYESDPLGFADNLLKSAEAYVRFLDGKNNDGSPNRYLDNIRYLSGAARQHLILLLAGRHLPKDAFVLLTRHLEDLFFAYIITHEPTREFERTFARWSTELRKAHNSADLEAIIANFFQPTKNGLAARFNLAFKELSEESLQQYRLRYVLAKLTQYVDEIAKGNNSPVTNLKAYINSGVEIEHILPKKPTQVVCDIFDKPNEYQKYMHLLGNLALLEKSINSSAGNNLFKEKQSAFMMSDFLLTKSLGREIRVGQHTAFERAAEHLESFTSWTSNDIERRQHMLGSLAQNVWDIDH